MPSGSVLCGLRRTAMTLSGTSLILKLFHISSSMVLCTWLIRASTGDSTSSFKSKLSVVTMHPSKWETNTSSPAWKVWRFSSRKSKVTPQLVVSTDTMRPYIRVGSVSPGHIPVATTRLPLRKATRCDSRLATSFTCRTMQSMAHWWSISSRCDKSAQLMMRLDSDSTVGSQEPSSASATGPSNLLMTFMCLLKLLGVTELRRLSMASALLRPPSVSFF
mmetsp:Transcript_5111/g.12780  ORF Transcript_5111/g.12780 Transcript_5111/m.12780 type:complete len:219 (+) Transcript_5111:996-1652(+)